MDEPLAKRTKPDYWSPDFWSLLNVNSKLPNELGILDTGLPATHQVYGDGSQTYMTSDASTLQQLFNSFTQLPPPGPATTEQFEWTLINDDLVSLNSITALPAAAVDSQQPMQQASQQLPQSVQQLEQSVQQIHQPVQELHQPMQQRKQPLQQLQQPVQQPSQPLQLQQSTQAATFPTGTSDPKKVKLIQQQLALLLHASKCRLDPIKNLNCKLPGCATMKDVLKHIDDRHGGMSCKFRFCATSRQIITHWKNCTRNDCLVCPPFKNITPDFRNTGSQATSQASTTLTSSVSAAVSSQPAKLNADMANAYSASELKTPHQLIYPESNQQDASSMAPNNEQFWTSEGQVSTNPSNALQAATVNSQQLQQPVQQPVQLPMLQLEQPVQLLHQPMQRMEQPVQQLGHPMQQLGHPVQQLGQPVQQLGHSMQQLGHPVQQLGHSTQQLGQPVQQLGHPVQQLGHPVQQLGHQAQHLEHPVQQLGHTLQQLGHPVQQLGHPVQQLEQPNLYIKRKMLGDVMAVPLLHAHKCLRREQQSQQPPCWLPHCATTKKLLNHMANCHQGKSCRVPHCAHSRRIITHWKNCTLTDCDLCRPLKGARNTSSQATSQASTTLTSVVSAAVSQAAKLNAAYSASGLEILFQPINPESNQQNASSMVTNNGQLWTSEGQANRFQQDGTVSHQGMHAGGYLGIEHRSATAEEWRQSITQDSRNHLIQKLVQAVFTPNPEQLHDPRINNLVQFSRKLEGDVFEQSSSVEEYQNKMAEKIYKIQQECQEKNLKKMSLPQESDEHRSLHGLVPYVPQQNHSYSLLSVGAESSLSSSCTNNTSVVSNQMSSIGASSNSSMSPLPTFDACDVTVKQENVVKIKEEIVDNDEPSWGLQQSFESFKSEAVKMEDVKSEFENSSPELVSVVEETFEVTRSSFDMDVVHGMSLMGKGVKEAFQQTKLVNEIVDEFKALSPVQENDIEKKTVEQHESIVKQYELLIREQDDQLHTVRLELSELKSKMADTQSNLEEAYKQIQLLKDQNALLKTHIGWEEDCRVKPYDLKRAPPRKVKKVPTTGITWTTISACNFNRRIKKLSSTKADTNRPNWFHTRVALLTRKTKQSTVPHKFVEKNNLSIRISELENKNSQLQAEIMGQNQKMEKIIDENSSLSSRFEEHDNLTLLNGELDSIRKSARKQLKELGEKLEIEDDDDDDNDMVDNVLPLHECIELDALKKYRDYIALVLFAEEYSRIKSYWKRLKELTEQLENEDDVDDDDDMDDDIDDVEEE